MTDKGLKKIKTPKSPLKNFPRIRNRSHFNNKARNKKRISQIKIPKAIRELKQNRQFHLPNKMQKAINKQKKKNRKSKVI